MISNHERAAGRLARRPFFRLTRPSRRFVLLSAALGEVSVSSRRLSAALGGSRRTLCAALGDRVFSSRRSGFSIDFPRITSIFVGRNKPSALGVSRGLSATLVAALGGPGFFPRISSVCVGVSKDFSRVSRAFPRMLLSGFLRISRGFLTNFLLCVVSVGILGFFH